MSQSLRALALEALAYINASGAVNDATLANASAPQKNRIAADLTAVMQELYEQAPALYKRSLGATLAAPANITLTTTNGSTTVTTASAFTEGATVFVMGVYNQIFTENGVKRLLLPATATGDQAAVLYGDVIALDPSVAVVLDEVFLVDTIRLRARNNRADLLGQTHEYPDYGRRRRFQVVKPTVGMPDVYWVEDFLLTDSAHVSTRRLRVNPLPNQQAQITYAARLAAPSFSASDLGTDSQDSSKSLVVANSYVESIVRPLFLKRWSASPWFRSEEAKKDILDDAARAGARIAAFASQQKRSRRMTAPI